MEKSLYSSSWYRVANLQPRLRSHASIHRQHFRGQLWYVLQDRTSGRFHRFTPPAYYVFSLMDGKRTVQEIWDKACSHLSDDVLTQDEMIRLLSQLHTADALYGGVPPDTVEVSERATKTRRRKLLMGFINPLSIRIPLIDPDEFLGATMPAVRWIFSRAGALFLIVVIGYAVTQAGVHWSELTNNLADRVLATESLLLLLITYPLVKALHELGHGYAVKNWGGEVHEIGVMFLVFMPVPYVDASDTSAFQEKWRRAAVGAAGIIVEALLASLALFVWLNVEEGLVKAFTFNVMLIGGVSTLLFNGNPLLRFDGYYVLSDLIEMPNLGTRSTRYLGYLIQRYLFGIEGGDSPATSPGEAPWLFFYAIASFCYRLVIMVAIISFVANRFFVIGVLLAMWSLVLMFALPLSKQLWFLFAGPALRRNRGRALAVTVGVLACIASLFMLIPMPYSTVAQGIVWAPGEASIHATAQGVVVKVLALPNARVVKGQPLIQMEDPLLDSRVAILQARVHELELRHSDRDVTDLVEAKMVAEQLNHARANMELAQQRQRDLLLRSSADGQFIVPRAVDLPGRFIKKGEILGYVARLEDPIVRVVVDEDEAELVRHRLRSIKIRRVETLSTVISARIDREVPGFSDSLPSPALSTVGGGEIVLDPSDPKRMKVLTKLLHLELKPEEAMPVGAMGGRVYVRFSYDAEPLASRMYRSARQLFLKRFNV